MTPSTPPLTSTCDRAPLWSRESTTAANIRTKTRDHDPNLIARHRGLRLCFSPHEILQRAQPNYWTKKHKHINIHYTVSNHLLMAAETLKTISGADKKKEGKRDRTARGRKGAKCTEATCVRTWWVWRWKKGEKVSWAEEAILGCVRFITPSCLRAIMFQGGPYNKVWRSIASIYGGAAHLIIRRCAAHRRSCDTHLGLWRTTE